MPKRKPLTRAAVMAAQLPEMWLPVSELGGDVLLRAMSLDDILEVMNKIGDDNGAFGKALIARMLIDPDTNAPMFTEDELNVIGERNGTAMLRIITEARKFIGLTSDVPKVPDSASSATDSTATDSNSPSDSEKS